ncbi:cupin domain-containing protein [Flavobacteriaceae bacterium 14752]|uniref:cupin domain-containing protein n=1 Tax=Mesohalobacter salilacus TaxID=2491711 RepID=UPI000F6354CE|nr:cupin domain-containing protein [Flavobacteriaceae bacterium 14752]
MPTYKDIINKLNLQPHPEGGYFKETYRSQGEILESSLGKDYTGNRNYSTSIYFLLTSNQFSAFHRITQDEIWHFYEGSPVKIHMISKAGDYSSIVVGRDFTKDQLPQYVVKGGIWFAAEVLDEKSFSLVGCTVSPGFDFKDFEMPSRQTLLELFPDLKSVITRFSHA